MILEDFYNSIHGFAKVFPHQSPIAISQSFFSPMQAVRQSFTPLKFCTIQYTPKMYDDNYIDQKLALH